jgi:hypothetical protein
LTDGYRRTIAGYLGQGMKIVPASAVNKHPQSTSQKISANETLKKLDKLDAQRRTIEDTIKPDTLKF